MFWRRVEGAPDGHIEAAGAKDLSSGEVAPLGPDIIIRYVLILRLTAILFTAVIFSRRREANGIRNPDRGPHDTEKTAAL